jgi:uncharacterized protein
MQFELNDSDNSLRIQAYDNNKLFINNKEYAHSLLISKTNLITDWPVQSAKEITNDIMQQLIAYQHTLILIGTGETQQMLSPELSSLALSQGIGLEVMSTPAACRTYNILLADHREALAAFIL